MSMPLRFAVSEKPVISLPVAGHNHSSFSSSPAAAPRLSGWTPGDAEGAPGPALDDGAAEASDGGEPVVEGAPAGGGGVPAAAVALGAGGDGGASTGGGAAAIARCTSRIACS